MDDHNWKTCEVEDCEECCTHDEHDHFICLDCGKQLEDIDYEPDEPFEYEYEGDK